MTLAYQGEVVAARVASGVQVDGNMVTVNFDRAALATLLQGLGSGESAQLTLGVSRQSRHRGRRSRNLDDDVVGLSSTRRDRPARRRQRHRCP